MKSIFKIFISCLIFFAFSSSAFADKNQELIDNAREGNYSAVERLLREGADVNAKDIIGWTVLMMASSRGHKEVVELLINKRADVNAKNNYDNTALTIASSYGHKEVVELLINKKADVKKKDKDGETALMIASSRGHKEVVELLINKGADVNAEGNNGRTALTIASERGHKEVVELLINKGADVNAKDIIGWTALMRASYNGHKEAVELLIKNGANRACLVYVKYYHCWYCYEYGSENENCIDRMAITFENKSYQKISSVTFILTIKDCDENIIYKKKHTVNIDLENEEVCQSEIFYLANKVYENSVGFSEESDDEYFPFDIEVLSVK